MSEYLSDYERFGEVVGGITVYTPPPIREQRRDDIAFAGLLIRKTDGTTWAVDLDAEHVRIEVDVDYPPKGSAELITIATDVSRGRRDEVEVRLHGTRRSGGDRMFTLRQLQPGEVPFPAEPSAAQRRERSEPPKKGS